MTEATDYLTTTEVAARAKCSERNVYRWRKRPDFPKPLTLPYASRVLFAAAEIDLFLEKREQAA